MPQKKMSKSTGKKILATQHYSDSDVNKIRETAYQLWESKGRPSNSALNDWLEAEKMQKKSVH